MQQRQLSAYSSRKQLLSKPEVGLWRGKGLAPHGYGQLGRGEAPTNTFPKKNSGEECQGWGQQAKHPHHEIPTIRDLPS